LKEGGKIKVEVKYQATT